MEPLPEVLAGAGRLAELTDTDPLAYLETLAGMAADLVPSCVGVSVTIVVDGEPFTLTSTSEQAALLDAIQHLDGGPCVHSAETETPVSVPDVLDEQRWRIYGRAATTLGVRSSLSAPLSGADGRTPGAINLYATEPDAFAGREAELAHALHVPVHELVMNADLSFMTREFARELPAQLAAKAHLDEAVDVLVALTGWTAAAARTRLLDAAANARLPSDQVAQLLLRLHDR